jgi:hypothetical protein
MFELLSHSGSRSQGFSGRSLAIPAAIAVIPIRTQYTKVPLAISGCWLENANKDVAPAGPTARARDAAVCAIPFVAPRVE